MDVAKALESKGDTNLTNADKHFQTLQNIISKEFKISSEKLVNIKRLTIQKSKNSGKLQRRFCKSKTFQSTTPKVLSIES